MHNLEVGVGFRISRCRSSFLEFRRYGFLQRTGPRRVFICLAIPNQKVSSADAAADDRQTVSISPYGLRLVFDLDATGVTCVAAAAWTYIPRFAIRQADMATAC